MTLQELRKTSEYNGLTGQQRLYLETVLETGDPTEAVKRAYAVAPRNIARMRYQLERHPDIWFLKALYYWRNDAGERVYLQELAKKRPSRARLDILDRLRKYYTPPAATVSDLRIAQLFPDMVTDERS